MIQRKSALPLPSLARFRFVFDEGTRTLYHLELKYIRQVQHKLILFTDYFKLLLIFLNHPLHEYWIKLFLYIKH